MSGGGGIGPNKKGEGSGVQQKIQLFRGTVIWNWRVLNYLNLDFAFYGSPKVPSVWCKILLICCKNFNGSCKIFLIG